MSLVDFWISISFLASRTLLVTGSLLLISYCIYKKKNVILVLVSIYGGIILNYFLKQIFQMPRPDNPLIPIDGYAFPSGHAMSAVIFYSLLMLIFGKEIKNKVARTTFIIAHVFIILLIGLSRIMLKVHSVYDVVGGYVIGFLWLFIVYKILQKIKY